MATVTIYSNAQNVLSWNPSTIEADKIENSSTLVVNSSGMTVYWTRGGSSGNIADSGSLNCGQGTSNKKWNFSEQASGGTVRITLTVTGSGGGAPSQKSQGGGKP